MRVDAGTIRDLAGNTIMSVVFKKRSTGEMRHMLCRLGCTKDVKGMGASYVAADRGLLTVWDMRAHGWRCIPLENIQTITVKGEKYEVCGA